MFAIQQCLRYVDHSSYRRQLRTGRIITLRETSNGHRLDKFGQFYHWPIGQAYQQPIGQVYE